MPRKYLVAAGIAAFLVVVLAFYLGSRLPGEPLLPGMSGGNPPTGEPQSATRSEVPEDVVVPSRGDTNVPEGVAVPKAEIQAAPGVSAKLRTFDISVSGGEFTPSTVAVNVGDTVHMDITAADKNYDFVQPDWGYSFSLPKGVKTPLEFYASNEGKYTFYCKSCGGPDEGPVGYIIVVKK